MTAPVGSVPERIIASVFAALVAGDATIATAIGRREMGANAKPHRVVAVPVGAPVIDLPDQPGDHGYSDAGRVILVRRFVIEWECHDAPAAEGAVDFTKSELLYLAVLRAVRTVCHHSVVFSDERWLDQEEGADGFERFGTSIRFISTIDLPVYEARGTIVTLTATPKTVTTVQINDNAIDQVIINEG